MLTSKVNNYLKSASSHEDKSCADSNSFKGELFCVSVWNKWMRHDRHRHRTQKAPTYDAAGYLFRFRASWVFWSSPAISRDPSEKRIDRSKNARMSVWDNGISIEWCGMNSIGMEWYDMEWFGLVWFFVLSAYFGVGIGCRVLRFFIV